MNSKRTRFGFLVLAGYAVLASVSASFVFFLPIYLGLPLQPASFYTRMWLSSWV